MEVGGGGGGRRGGMGIVVRIEGIVVGIDRMG